MQEYELGRLKLPLWEYLHPENGKKSTKQGSKCIVLLIVWSQGQQNIGCGPAFWFFIRFGPCLFLYVLSMTAVALKWRLVLTEMDGSQA